ncbi:MAG: hypothetical protein IJK41_11470 [Muribaculaceae bacterium]|nr:hypothetical protein [Muribaculaceae bacterium]
MKRFFRTLVALVALLVAAPTTLAADWFDIISVGGETIAVNPDIQTSDKGKTFLVWVRNSFDVPEARAEYSRDRGYSKPVAYKLTLYKFTDNWKKFNIVQVSVYGEDGVPIDQYTNDAASTESYDITSGTPTEMIAENAKVIYEITTNPE